MSLTLDALVTPETEEYLTSEALSSARLFLPGVGVEVERERHGLHEQEQFLRGRGKEFRATARLKLRYRLTQDRWSVYRACVRQGVLDLAAAARDPARTPAVILAAAEQALEVAAALTKSAEERRPVSLREAQV